jgi:predicted nucleotidyltransferase
MKKLSTRRVAEEAARLLVEGVETEYLQAKERAVMMLGLTEQSRLPSNRQIKDCIESLTKTELGGDELRLRVRAMREIAEQIMTVISDCDPFLIGSTLSGQIRKSSDIDIHAYCDDAGVLTSQLSVCGYQDLEEEVVENRKGRFIHVRWQEKDYPVEITIYPWSWREIIPISSVTGKPMKRADLRAVRGLLKQESLKNREA